MRLEPRVSVLVTFYNQEKYVDHAIKSVLNQKADFDIKILVGDDGSSDGTQDKVKNWINKYPERIEMHVMERKAGKHISGFRASRNRLNLLKYVNTEYFIYLDGDDYFSYEGKIQRQVEILDDLKNQDCIGCGHNTDMMYLDGRRISMVPPQIGEGKYSLKEYWNSLYFHTDSLLIRSYVISSIDKELVENNFNDNLITYLFIQRGSLYYIPESWAIYLQTNDGIWTGGNLTVNYIRNLFLIDLCNQINPSMRKETAHRFSSTWIGLLRIRKQINADELKEFSLEALDKNMTDSYKWIHYSELSLLNKQVLCIEALRKCWKQMMINWGIKIYHIFIRPND